MPSLPQRHWQSFPMGLFPAASKSHCAVPAVQDPVPSLSGCRGRSKHHCTAPSVSGQGELEAPPGCTGILFPGRWGGGRPGLPPHQLSGPAPPGLLVGLPSTAPCIPIWGDVCDYRLTVPHTGTGGRRRSCGYCLGLDLVPNTHLMQQLLLLLSQIQLLLMTQQPGVFLFYLLQSK